MRCACVEKEIEYIGNYFTKNMKIYIKLDVFKEGNGAAGPYSGRRNFHNAFFNVF